MAREAPSNTSFSDSKQGFVDTKWQTQVDSTSKVIGLDEPAMPLKFSEQKLIQKIVAES